MEKRIIAFDIGDKRIGIAASDPFNTFALPGTTYFRTKSAAADAEALAAIVREKDAGLIVCGLPFNFDGTESVQTEKTRRFVELLKTKTDVPIVFPEWSLLGTKLKRRDFRLDVMLKAGDKPQGEQTSLFDIPDDIRRYLSVNPVTKEYMAEPICEYLPTHYRKVPENG